MPAVSMLEKTDEAFRTKRRFGLINGRLEPTTEDANILFSVNSASGNPLI